MPFLLQQQETSSIQRLHQTGHTPITRQTGANKGSSEVGGAENLPLALEHRVEFTEQHCSVSVPESASGKAA